MRRRAALMGVALGRPYSVLAARCRDSHHRRRTADAAAPFAAHAGGLAGEYRGNVVVVLPGDQDPAAPARRPPGAGRGRAGDGRCGNCFPRSGRHRRGLPRGRPLSRSLLALDRDGEAASPGELGIYGLLFHQVGRDELDRFVRRTIGPVLDYDTQRGGDLARTLLTYFA
ncbi:hypothetical protein [Streptomyces sp. NPDC055681]